MRRMRVLLASLCGIVLLSSFVAPKDTKKDKEDEAKRVYLYGVSIDFNDSTVYMTDIQYLDSMIIQKDGSLQGQSGYSLQMKVFLENSYGEDNQTCAIVYSDNKKKLEKKFVKMRKRYQTDKGRTLKLLGTDSFTFRKE